MTPLLCQWYSVSHNKRLGLCNTILLFLQEYTPSSKSVPPSPELKLVSTRKLPSKESPPCPLMSSECATSNQLQEKEAKCKLVIENIRHEEFGIGIKLKGKQQLVAAKQREREGRGIKRLSLELYSTDTHFVLELIQNAATSVLLKSFLLSSLL